MALVFGMCFGVGTWCCTPERRYPISIAPVFPRNLQISRCVNDHLACACALTNMLSRSTPGQRAVSRNHGSAAFVDQASSRITNAACTAPPATVSARIPPSESQVATYEVLHCICICNARSARPVSSEPQPPDRGAYLWRSVRR